MRDIVNVTLRLLILMLIAGLCLGFTNSMTEGPIAQQAEMTAQALRKEVLPGAEDFADLSIQTGGVRSVFEGSVSGAVKGYAVEVAVNGFGGEILLTVGISQGEVTGVRISSMAETPGLGANAKNASFLSQFNGKKGEIAVIKVGTPADTEISAITAATITSKAVTSAVNEALALYGSDLAEREAV